MLVLRCNCWLAWRNGDRLGWLHSTLFMGGKLQGLMFFNFGDKYIWYSDYFRHVLTTGIKLLPDITSALVLVQISVTTGLCCWFSNQVCHMSLIAESTVATYQFIILVELTFKVIVICSISTQYKFNGDRLEGVIPGFFYCYFWFPIPVRYNWWLSGVSSFFIAVMASPRRHQIDPPVYTVTRRRLVCDEIPVLHGKSIPFFRYFRHYTAVVFCVNGHSVGVTFCEKVLQSRQLHGVFLLNVLFTPQSCFS